MSTSVGFSPETAEFLTRLYQEHEAQRYRPGLNETFAKMLRRDLIRLQKLFSPWAEARELGMAHEIPSVETTAQVSEALGNAAFLLDQIYQFSATDDDDDDAMEEEEVEETAD